ncbi:hypothetical protein [Hymenobacter fodinae]|uniref:hypothetical protein n=1 Tax=Hymenobacter fodinae TaxID=2510796 RepID=UPI0014367FDE|nr:hypothetical protein [Hymenobacter fodinae]
MGALNWAPTRWLGQSGWQSVNAETTRCSSERSKEPKLFFLMIDPGSSLRSAGQL